GSLGDMSDAWQILRDAGLPLEGPRAPVFGHSVAELGAATRSAIAEAPAGRPAEALAAFVFAWQQHWPAAFATAFGTEADGLVGWAAGRIALAHLAHVL